MAATVLALGAAVALAVAYPLLYDRLEQASVSRRQLDIWVFLGGLLCMTGIVFGGAGAARTSADPDAQASSAPSGPQVVTRQRPVSLTVSADVAPVGSDASVDTEWVNVAPAADDVGSAAEAPSDRLGEPAPYESIRRATRPPGSASDVAVVGGEAEEPRSSHVLTESVSARLPAIAEPTVEPVVVILPTAEPVLPPTSQWPGPEPTQVPPEPRETATPVCGDPRDMVIDLDVLDASIYDDTGRPSVRYRAQVHNRSTFPVTLAEIHVALESRDSGAEVFGADDLPDRMVEPSVVLALEGTLQLSKSPSPFGTSQLCVSLVSHTCGRTLPYHATRRCLVARGF